MTLLEYIPAAPAAAPSRSASAERSAWSARALATASGLAASTKLGYVEALGERVALLLGARDRLGETGLLGRRGRSRPSSGRTKVASSTTTCAAPPRWRRIVADRLDPGQPLQAPPRCAPAAPSSSAAASRTMQPSAWRPAAR